MEELGYRPSYSSRSSHPFRLSNVQEIPRLPSFNANNVSVASKAGDASLGDFEVGEGEGDWQEENEDDEEAQDQGDRGAAGKRMV
jgi:hypothetical protein